MNILGRLNEIALETPFTDIGNTGIDVSPEALDILIEQHGDELTISDSPRGLRAQTNKIGSFTWLIENNSLIGDEFYLHLQQLTVSSGNLCQSAHQRLWWLSKTNV